MHTSLINAVPIKITYRDGKAETVEVKELSIRHLYKFIEHFQQNDTPGLVALSVGKDLEWVDTLEDASFAALAKESIKANFPRATEMFKSDITVAARLAPVFHRLAMAEAMLAGEPSKTKSPAPAASVSPEEAGKVSSTSPQGG